MPVNSIARNRPRTATAHAVSVAPSPAPSSAPFAYQLPAQLPLGEFTKAQGEWTADWDRAHRDAAAALAQIDFTRGDLILWVPGTDCHSVHRDFERAVQYLYGVDGDYSLSYLPYEASWQFRTSVPTGLATLKLVLEGIRQRLDAMPQGSRRPRVLLAGTSQGAWLIGEALADPSVGSIVARAQLTGHPWLAKTQYVDGHDARVKELNHRLDQIAMPIKGDLTRGMDAMTAVRTGTLKQHLGLVASAILANPIHGALLAQGYAREIPWLRPLLRDPHMYGYEMPRIVRWLRDGVWDSTDEELDDRERHRQDSYYAPGETGS